MSRAFFSAVAMVAAALAGAPGATAQALSRTPSTELRARLARLEQDAPGPPGAGAARESRTTWAVVRSGDVALAVPGDVRVDRAQVLARALDSVVTTAGLPPRGFVRGRILVLQPIDARPFATEERDLKERQPVYFDARPVDLGYGTLPAPALALQQQFHETLDPVWRGWAPWDLGIAWSRDMERRTAIVAVTQPGSRVGERCLAGEVAACRLYLGVDDDVLPYRTRYAVSELRARAEEVRWANTPDLLGCRRGDDATCIAWAERSGWVRLVPASGGARATLLRSVAVLHGPDALRRALADTSGPVSERLSRASGVPVDSLMVQWRYWALSGGNPERVRAGMGDIVAALATAALLAYLATRSTPWT
jgi:hypothetical protein